MTAKTKLRTVDVSKQVWRTAEQRYPEFACGGWVKNLTSRAGFTHSAWKCAKTQNLTPLSA
jgi:hypothetical protein